MALAMGTALLVTVAPGFVSGLASQGKLGVTKPAVAAAPPMGNGAIAEANFAQSPSQFGANDAFQRGQRLYEQGQYQSAIAPLQATIQAFAANQNPLGQAIALGNLSLVYQQLGQWPLAETAIAQSLELLANATPDPLTEASLIDIQANLQLKMGQTETALATFQQAAQRYQAAVQSEPAASQSGQAETSNRRMTAEDGLLKNRLNQAQALRVLGFYRRALNLLEDSAIPDRLDQLTSTQVTQLRLLGDALRLSGRPDAARLRLEQSVAGATQLNDQPRLSRAQLSLANALRTSGETSAALELYQQAADQAETSDRRLSIQVNQLTLLLQVEQWDDAHRLWRELANQLPQLTPSRATLYTQVYAVQTVLEADPAQFLIPDGQLLPLLEPALENARRLGDRRAEAHVLGTLGQLWERSGALERGSRLTREALQLSQSFNAPDISYRLNWQLGRLLNQQGEITGAISAYDAAIQDLQALRQDLVSIDREIQFSFKESVEPVYRESVSLLVKASQKTPNRRAQNLERARARIEALQLAELDNFFREACLDGQTVLLDQVVDQENPTTAIVYPIILADQLEVIVKIPGQPLQSHSIDVSAETVQTLLRDLRRDLPDITRTARTRRNAQQVYQWLLQPFESALAQTSVDTLVFVLDGAFRNVPMGVLYDGEQYLIEKYAVGVSLGLQLQQPQALAEQQLNVLAAGLIEPPAAFRRFPVLPNIEQEFQLMDNSGIANEQLLNQAFTREKIAAKLKQAKFNIVHLATHGQFSSQASETFILAADGPIQVEELDRLLRDRDQTDVLELLILSACQTAAGDDRAALGLAGIAVKAGARSTLASLWQVDDRSTALVMGQFYQQLSQDSLSKAEALRRSQLALLNDEDLRAPAYWAPYILVGNWL